eukprot:SAG31_NODE_979_length_10600_cov_13.736025_4_plen_39_part_00
MWKHKCAELVVLLFQLSVLAAGQRHGLDRGHSEQLGGR